MYSDSRWEKGEPTKKGQKSRVELRTLLFSACIPKTPVEVKTTVASNTEETGSLFAGEHAIKRGGFEGREPYPHLPPLKGGSLDIQVRGHTLGFLPAIPRKSNADLKIAIWANRLDFQKFEGLLNICINVY